MRGCFGHEKRGRSTRRVRRESQKKKKALPILVGPSAYCLTGRKKSGKKGCLPYNGWSPSGKKKRGGSRSHEKPSAVRREGGADCAVLPLASTLEGKRKEYHSFHDKHHLIGRGEGEKEERRGEHAVQRLVESAGEEKKKREVRHRFMALAMLMPASSSAQKKKRGTGKKRTSWAGSIAKEKKGKGEDIVLEVWGDAYSASTRGEKKGEEVPVDHDTAGEEEKIQCSSPSSAAITAWIIRRRGGGIESPLRGREKR